MGMDEYSNKWMVEMDKHLVKCRNKLIEVR